MIHSLGKFPGVTGKINAIELLGHAGRLTWTHDADGVSVKLPEQKPCKYAVALKISGENLRGFKPELAPAVVSLIQPDSSGTLALTADDAELKGGTIKVEERGGQSNIGFWYTPDESASWKVNFKEPGKYKVTASIAAMTSDALAVVEVADRTIELKPSATGSWDKYSEIDAGTIEITQRRRADRQGPIARETDLEAHQPALGQTQPCRFVIGDHIGDFSAIQEHESSSKPSRGAGKEWFPCRRIAARFFPVPEEYQKAPAMIGLRLGR